MAEKETGDVKREREKDNRWRERRKREKEIITRSVFSHLHSIPDG